jgi:hypothetical protein
MVSPNLVREPFLTGLLQVYPHLRDATVNIAYPNYALLSQDGRKCVIKYPARRPLPSGMG